MTKKPVAKPSSEQVEKDNHFKSKKYKAQQKAAEGKEKPRKA